LFYDESEAGKKLEANWADAALTISTKEMPKESEMAKVYYTKQQQNNEIANKLLFSNFITVDLRK
jgi:hypothetical protein